MRTKHPSMNRRSKGGSLERLGAATSVKRTEARRRKRDMKRGGAKKSAPRVMNLRATRTERGGGKNLAICFVIRKRPENKPGVGAVKANALCKKRKRVDPKRDM